MKQQLAGTLMACIAVFTGGATLAEVSATGTVKPLRSVQFSPDNDVKCLSSAVETGDPTRVFSTYADALETDRLTRAVVAATGRGG